MKDWQGQMHKIQNVAMNSISFATLQQPKQQSTLALTTQSQNFATKGCFDEQKKETRSRDERS